MDELNYYYYEDIKNKKEIKQKSFDLEIKTFEDINRYITSQMTEMPCKYLKLNYKLNNDYIYKVEIAKPDLIVKYSEKWQQLVNAKTNWDTEKYIVDGKTYHINDFVKKGPSWYVIKLMLEEFWKNKYGK